MSILNEKFKEVLSTVLPITVLVTILNFTLTPIDTTMFIQFLIGAAFIIVGMSIFLVGVDIGVTPIGSYLGASLPKINKIWFLGLIGIILGFFISIAEPDLHILAGQVQDATGGTTSKMSIVIIVSIGIAILLSIGLLRIMKSMYLNRLLTFIYIAIFSIAAFVTPDFLAIAFDASGATTGALTVPFMLALGFGVSSLKSGPQSEDDSFGLVGVTSSGAILAVMIYSLFTNTNNGESVSVSGKVAGEVSFLEPFLHELIVVLQEIFLALLPLLIIFLIGNRISLKVTKRQFNKILKGVVYTFIGLVLFLTGVNAGFMKVGSVVGHSLASYDNQLIVVLVGFILGLVVILAEPAVHVLTQQVEDVTGGHIKRKVILFTLSIGVGIAVALSMIRIITPDLQLWHIILPGYIISIILSYIVPSLFVGIAFDSGGVASGPMTATFVLAFAHGVAEATSGANVLIDGFGVIALVAMTPLVALQILGLIFKIKSKKEGLD